MLDNKRKKTYSEKMETMMIHCFSCLHLFSWQSKPYSVKKCDHFICGNCLLAALNRVRDVSGDLKVVL